MQEEGRTCLVAPDGDVLLTTDLDRERRVEAKDLEHADVAFECKTERVGADGDAIQAGSCNRRRVEAELAARPDVDDPEHVRVERDGELQDEAGVRRAVD